LEHANVPLVYPIGRAEQFGGGEPLAVAFTPITAIRSMSPASNSSPVRSGI
jgi:hypothetical protein